MKPRDHELAEVDDDGGNPGFKRYRFVCRCGRVGPWTDSISQARSHHAVHRSEAK